MPPFVQLVPPCDDGGPETQSQPPTEAAAGRRESADCLPSILAWKSATTRSASAQSVAPSPSCTSRVRPLAAVTVPHVPSRAGVSVVVVVVVVDAAASSGKGGSFAAVFDVAGADEVEAITSGSRSLEQPASKPAQTKTAAQVYVILTDLPWLTPHCPRGRSRIRLNTVSIQEGAGRAGRSLARQALNAPNLLSLLRLALVPVFLWLLLGPEEDGFAILILMFAGFSDWLDGKLARWLNQMSRLGQLLDPAADRLYIMAILIAFLLRDILPWWVIAALVGREFVLLVCVAVLRGHNFTYPEVTYVGKGATFVLMYAFPLLLLVQGGYVTGDALDVIQPLAYAFMIWGGVLYVWSGVLYAIQTAMGITRPRGAREIG